MSLRTEKRGSLGHELARRPRFRRKLENYELRLLGNEKLSFELPLGGISYSRNYPVRGLPLEINMNSLSSLPPPPHPLDSSFLARRWRGAGRGDAGKRRSIARSFHPSSLLPSRKLPFFLLERVVGDRRNGVSTRNFSNISLPFEFLSDKCVGLSRCFLASNQTRVCR